MKEPSAKDFGKHALNTSTVGATKASTTMGNSIEDDDDMPVSKMPVAVSADTRARLTALFEEYDTADDEVSNAEKALEAATKARSDVVEQIAGMISPQKKIVRRQRELTIVQRGSTYFFRGAGKSKPELIEV